MPTYVLEGGSSVTLPAKPLTIRVQGPRQGEVRLEAHVGGVADATAIAPMPGMLVLPRVKAPVELRVLPGRDRTFGSGTVVSLSAGIELRGDPDPERAVLSGLDLSGLAHRALLRVEPHGAELRLTALDVVVDTPLPPLAARARDVARELLGIERVPGDAATPLDVVVDASASMRALALDGSVGAAMELVVGVSRVTAGEEAVRVEVATDRAAEVRADTVVELPRAVHEAVLATPLSTGFRWRGSGRHPYAGGRSRAHCVVTDGVPADLPEAGSDLPGLVVICTPSTRSVLAARAPATTTWVPVADWGTVSAYQLLMEDDAALRAAVSDLLSAILPADSPLQSRLRETAGGIDDDMTNLRSRLP